MALTSSQGNTYGISGARKVSIKKTRSGSATQKLDSSTLGIAHGGCRTYEDGLADNGPNPSNGGVVVTVTVETLGAPPAAGTTKSFDGVTCLCTESSQEANAGALATGTATFTSDYDANATPCA